MYICRLYTKNKNMGAFGELLIKTWGGDLEHYRGNDIKREKSTEMTYEEQIKAREEFAKMRKLSYARDYLHRLTTNIIYKSVDYTQITEVLFRDSYKKINAENWVIDAMWSEYTEFLNKYVIK